MPIHGSAGKTFSGAAGKKFGAAGRVGAEGERDFARLLQSAGLTNDYSVFASMRTPADKSGSGKTYKSDVDFAIANGNSLILIDVKRWSAKKSWWSFGGYPFHGFMPHFQNGQWKPLSRNMQMALNRTRQHLPGVRVEAVVIFVATSSGKTPPNVSFMTWPGGIHSYLPNPGLRRIRSILGRREPVNRDIQAFCAKHTQ